MNKESLFLPPLEIDDKEVFVATTRIFENLSAEVILKDRAVLQSVIIIGSNVNPGTRRKKSDMDLVAILNDESVLDSKKFKYMVASHQIRVSHFHGQHQIPIDVKFYTESSFEKELFKNSLTRLFAFLHAYKIIYNQSETVVQTIEMAKERQQLVIENAVSELKDLPIEATIKNIQVYFSDAFLKLTSQKLNHQYLLVNCHLFEGIKSFFVQFLRLLYAKDIQTHSIENRLLFEDLIRHFLVLNQPDGTRLMNFEKYLVDDRLTVVIQKINQVLALEPIHTHTLQTIIKILNEAMQLHFNCLLVQEWDEDFHFETMQQV